MQAIMETLFDIIYLFTVISLGIIIIKKSQGQQEYHLFGIMAILLGCGDAFHLIPRAYALCTTGLEAHAAALGFGKFVTSITMTIFYVILYHIYKIHYQVKDKKLLTITIYSLAIIRILFCLFPQNQWFAYHGSLSFGIYRNIPFALLGLFIIILFYKETKRSQDNSFRFMWLAITLSFAFYIPVVLFSSTIPIVGILMIPKTLAYVWIVFMGYSICLKEAKQYKFRANKVS